MLRGAEERMAGGRMRIIPRCQVLQIHGPRASGNALPACLLACLPGGRAAYRGRPSVRRCLARWLGQSGEFGAFRHSRPALQTAHRELATDGVKKMQRTSRRVSMLLHVVTSYPAALLPFWIIPCQHIQKCYLLQ